MQKGKCLSSKTTIFCGLFTALIAVGAFISIPFPAMSFSMQIFFIYIGIVILGKKAAYSALVYMILGLIGLPIFTKGGGFWYIFQPSFGYIPGFIISSALCGYLSDKYPKVSFRKYILLGLLCIAISYASGMAYYYFLNTLYLGNPITAHILFAYLFLPFIPGDVLSIIGAAIIAKKTVPILRNQKILPI